MPTSDLPRVPSPAADASLRCEVLVLGAGPAGLVAAASCRRLGLDVRVLAPDPRAPWDRQLACWEEELPAWVPASWRRTRWEVMNAAGRTGTAVPKAYVALDVPAMQRELLDELAPCLTTGCADALSPGAMGVSTRSESGPLEARVVVDARGAAGGGQSWQSAFGLEVTLDRPWTGGAWLMDFRGASRLPPLGAAKTGPSFCYVLPFTPERVLFEETILMGSEPPEVLDALERRLRARLDSWGVAIREVHRVERCRIPMDATARPVPPALRGRVVRFGAAAGLTHPATGYQLGLALRRAGPLAEAVRRVVSGGPAGLESAVWPDEALAAHALHRFGASAIQDLDAESTAAFFDAFFALSPEQSVGYLARTLSVAELRAAMWTLFCRASWRTRLQLQRAALRDPGGALRGVFAASLERAA